MWHCPRGLRYVPILPSFECRGSITSCAVILHIRICSGGGGKRGPYRNPFILNYGDRYRHDETMSKALVDSTVNYVVRKRFVKKP